MTGSNEARIDALEAEVLGVDLAKLDQHVRLAGEALDRIGGILHDLVQKVDPGHADEYADDLAEVDRLASIIGHLPLRP